MKKILIIFSISLIALFVSNQVAKGQEIETDTSILVLPSDTVLFNSIVPADKLTFILKNELNCYKDGDIQFNSTDWDNIYFSACSGAFVHPLLPEITTVNDNAIQSIKNNIYPIGILDLYYLTIKMEAYSNGLISFEDETPYINPIATASDIFEIKNILAVSFFSKEKFPRNITFKLDRNFIFSNNPDEILYVDINFGDGTGVHRLNKGDEININFPGNGIYKTSIKTYYGGKESTPIIIDINVEDEIFKAPSQYSDYRIIESVITDFNYNPINHPDEKYGNKGRAEVKTWCSESGSENTLKYLDKPVIIIDGFDPDPQKRDCDDLYEMTQSWNNTIDELNLRCCDIVTVNWLGGGDWMQKNAFALIEVINFINANKKGYNDIVLIGPSMGGVIARYALAYMEQHNMPHHVGLLITDDSPHRGANIPLGLQFNVSFFSDISPNAEQGTRQMICPASRQLLVYHYDTHQDGLRTGFLNELNALGNYPTKPLLYAMASGSGTGKSQRNNTGGILNPGSEIYYMECEKGILGKVVWAHIWALPDENDPKTTIFHGKKTIFHNEWVWFPPHWELSLEIIWEKVKVKNTKPYDNCPGGYYPNYAQLQNEDDSKCDMSISLYYPFFTFVPTISALDLDHSINDLYYPNIVASQTPFDKIIYTTTPQNEMPPYQYAYNEMHCYITEEKQNDLFQYMGNGYPNNLMIQNKLLYSPVLDIASYIQTNNIITAGANIDPNQTSGNVIIKNNCNVKFWASNKVCLKPGFKVEHGALFDADAREPEYVCNLRNQNLFTKTGGSTEMNDEFDVDWNENVAKIEEKENNNDSKVHIFPNPTNGNLNVDIIGEYKKIEIKDIYGKTIFQTDRVNSSNQFDLSSYSKGLYFILLYKPNKEVEINKVILN